MINNAEVFAGKLIALHGEARAGKDTVASIIKQIAPRTKIIAFSDPMKDICRTVFEFSEEQLYGSLRDTPDDRYDGLTPRRALQLLGTEWGRACWPRVWIHYALRCAHEHLTTTHIAVVAEGRKYYAALCELVVITDCRFENEFNCVQLVHGEVWNIARPSAGVKTLSTEAAVHSSEAAAQSGVLAARCDRRVMNDAGLGELTAQVTVAYEAFRCGQ